MLKTITALTFANATAQAVQLLAQIWLVRIYAPSDFGLLAQLLSLSSFAAVIATLQINNCLVTLQKADERIELTNIGISYTFLVSILIVIGISLSSTAIFGGDVNLSVYVILYGLIASLSIGNIVKGVAVSKDQFSALVKFTLTRSIALIGSQTILGVIGIANGLIVGLLLGEVIATVVVLFSQVKELRLVNMTVFPYKLIRVIRRNHQFMVFGTLQELISVATFMAPLYFFSRLYGYDTGGQFALAHRITWAPISLLGQAISPVLFKSFVDFKAPELKQSKLLDIRITISLILLLASLGYVLMTPLFILVFGHEWILSAQMSRWIVIWCIAFLAALPYRIMLRVMKLQHIQLFIDLCTLGSILVMFFYVSSSETVLFAICIVGILQNLSLIGVSKSFVSRSAPGVN